jgi:hypothetical protein
MKKFLAALTLLIGFQANAGLITIAADQNNVEVGDSVLVTLTGSGFDAFDAFNFDFLFDTTTYSFVENSLSSDLALLDEVEPGEGLRATEFVDSGVFFDLFQWDEVVTAGEDFVLASFELTAIGSGQDIFGFDESSFSSFFDGELSVDTSYTLSSSVRADSTSVPEPTSLAILALGLMVLVARRANK